ncbi:MAG: hypothetical protein CM1200mP2_26110 [Planctomycetaceae bacterium]|nr:MAG: hypothetical protein CM1200mP2_26110 [Planctomycetaceae bacterium]
MQYNEGRPYEGFSDPSYHTDLYVTRSTDNGATWETPIRSIADREKMREPPLSIRDARRGTVALAMGTWFQSESGPLPKAKQFSQAFLWRPAMTAKLAP